VLKKSKHDNATLFIDASTEFVRNGNKNKLTDAHQQKILDAYTGRKSIEHFARLVDNGDIAEPTATTSLSRPTSRRSITVWRWISRSSTPISPAS
jgi:type I restriction enzyme M protein